MTQDKDNKADNKGQQKSHEVRKPTGETRTMTQQEWRERDKSEGWERVDGETDTAVEPPTAS